MPGGSRDGGSVSSSGMDLLPCLDIFHSHSLSCHILHLRDAVGVREKTALLSANNSPHLTQVLSEAGIRLQIITPRKEKLKHSSV